MEKHCTLKWVFNPVSKKGLLKTDGGWEGCLLERGDEGKAWRLEV